VLPLAASYGFDAPNAAAAVRAAVRAAGAGAAGQSRDAGQRAGEFLADMATRVATGVAAVSVVLDPGLVVLGGEVGLAGGAALASRVAAEVGRICPASPEVVPTGISRGPVLRGAILAAVDQARADLLESVASLEAAGLSRDCPSTSRRLLWLRPRPWS
jgi:predicted NBD/HSP70 family sugar kinase